MRDPGAFEILDIDRCELRQSRIARIAPIAADMEPFLSGGFGQVGFGLGGGPLGNEHCERQSSHCGKRCVDDLALHVPSGGRRLCLQSNSFAEKEPLGKARSWPNQSLSWPATAGHPGWHSSFAARTRCG